MGYIWDYLLYRPLLNLLVYLYDTIAVNNLGLAVVWLTILVRLALLPLSIIVERNKSVYNALAERLAKLRQGFQKDPVMEREVVRDILKKNRIKPWANVALLGVQLLVLVLLYQVFIGGIHLSGENVLYSFVKLPEKIDTTFVGIFDVAQRNLVVSLIVSIFLFINLRLEFRGQKQLVNQKNAFFAYGLPVFTFMALFALPSVKALFIITSMLVSQVIHFVQKPIYEAIYEKKLAKLKGAKAATAPAEAAKNQPFTYVGNPWDELRKRAPKKPS